MHDVTFLGVWMTPDVGETVSFVMNIDQERLVLVDCGTNLVGSLAKRGIEANKITHLIITHPHGDHISGLPTFLFYRLLIAPSILGKKPRELNIIGTKDTIRAVREYTRIAYGALADNPLLNYVEIDTSARYPIEAVTFQFFATKHQPETVGFLAEGNGKKIVYSSDTAVSEDVLEHARNADLLIHDVVGTCNYKMLSSTHTLCNEISPLLDKYFIKCLCPVHRLPIYKDHITEYYEELRREYSGKIIIPNDGDVIVLNEMSVR